MAIDYIEVRGADRELLGIVDTAQSVIWHTVWYGVGDFEVYVKSTEALVSLLQVGRYVTRSGSDEVGIIEKIEVKTTDEEGAMLTVTGRFVKSILDRRLIYSLSGTSNTAVLLRGNVEAAVRSLVKNNAISCTFDSRRNIPMLELGALAGITAVIIDESGNAAVKQVSYQNLLEYSDELLEEYELSATVILDENTKKFQYVVKQGADRSSENNRDNVPVVFSRDFDNLSDSKYEYDVKNLKNAALIGGEGEGVDRFYAVIAPASTGLERREVFVDASSVNRKYKDESDVEQEYTDSEYSAMLKTQGRQKLATLTASETFEGIILVSEGNKKFNEDFFLGDIVTVQENSINKYVDVRITEATEVQDESGYTVDVKYE